MEQPLAFEIPDLRLWVQTERKTNTFWFRDFLKRKNQYFDFINKHKNLISMNEIRDSSLIYHIHHIVPKFLLTTTEELNFMDSNENTILLSLPSGKRIMLLLISYSQSFMMIHERLEPLLFFWVKLLYH